MIMAMNLIDFTPVALDRASVDQLDLVNQKFTFNASDVLREMAELNFVALRFCPIFDTLSDDDLAQLAVNLVYQLASVLGGSQPYIPCGEQRHKNKRDETIFHDFKGNNYLELSRRFNLTEPRIRQIINMQRLSNRKTSAAE